MAQKVGEKGVETALAALAESDELLLGEAADLIFHLTVLLRSRGLSLRDGTACAGGVGDIRSSAGLELSLSQLPIRRLQSTSWCDRARQTRTEPDKRGDGEKPDPSGMPRSCAEQHQCRPGKHGENNCLLNEKR